jgi:hypothetical protein
MKQSVDNVCFFSRMGSAMARTREKKNFSPLGYEVGGVVRAFWRNERK